jgi:ribosome maturation factor RimP
MFAYEKLDGLDRDQLLSAIEPVLRAHGVRGVELIWRTDHRGWVLYLTLEADSEVPLDGGVTLEQCTDVSRDLSAALDVTDVIRPAFRLEVGSPGVERRLYSMADFSRFAGRLVKVKLRAPLEGEWTLRGKVSVLAGDRIRVETDAGPFEVPFGDVESANLVLDWSGASGAPRRANRPDRQPAAKPGQRNMQERRGAGGRSPSAEVPNPDDADVMETKQVR